MSRMMREHAVAEEIKATSGALEDAAGRLPALLAARDPGRSRSYEEAREGVEDIDRLTRRLSALILVLRSCRS